jgi:hypothetical protein
MMNGGAVVILYKNEGLGNPSEKPPPGIIFPLNQGYF